MPNIKKHAIVGAGTAAVVAALVNLTKQLEEINKNPERRFDWFSLATFCLMGGAIGAVGGILPDLFEPPNHPQHRKFFHSVAAASGVGYCMIRVNNNSTLTHEEKQVFNSVAASYLSHLYLDSETAFGLPLVA